MPHGKNGLNFLFPCSALKTRCLQPGTQIPSATSSTLLSRALLEHPRAAAAKARLRRERDTNQLKVLCPQHDSGLLEQGGCPLCHKGFAISQVLTLHPHTSRATCQRARGLRTRPQLVRQLKSTRTAGSQLLLLTHRTHVLVPGTQTLPCCSPAPAGPPQRGPVCATPTAATYRPTETHSSRAHPGTRPPGTASC